MSRFYEYQKRIVSVFLICLMCMSVYACGKKQDAREKIKDLDCTVIAEDKIPEECAVRDGQRHLCGYEPDRAGAGGEEQSGGKLPLCGDQDRVCG